MNVIVSLMAAGAKKHFTKEEFRRVRIEADVRFRKMVSENKDCPKALKKHTGMNIPLWLILLDANRIVFLRALSVVA